ncbi:c-type cytochrome biogenesis protein CcsB [Sinomonas cyclohexanicum]|uniref:C-type cytochrome biogenesis protein CcsB n=1 Tax=Sinomonas cyclohexanicum TaxID=322009 RepID=A0ABM7PYM1_SINCY|nr:c-type cytochrome biogenesis protein CcsB [Corynebacterium cyclohexanicum]BCT77401.1 c-type cytochrome biogenesis protein CcsB [Corynebacterium cyclohexanicum]
MPPINFLLGDYSELFMLLAAGTYVVAFLAFAWDMATSGKVAQHDAARLAKQNNTATKAAAAVKEPALAGAATTAKGAGSGGGGHAPSSAGKGSGADTVEVADPDLKYRSRRKAARVGVALSILGLVIHAAGVLTRGIAAGRVPWGNMYEFCTTGAFLVVAVFLVVLIRRDLRFLGTFVLGLAVVMMVAAAVAFYVPVGHLVPALQSYWLVIHVSIAVLSSALFTLTFSMSILQLIQGRREAKIAGGAPDTGRFMRLVPSSLTLEALSYRINTIAFVGWTLTVMFGSIWAEKAWGRFWGWDTKEVWSFVIWVVYAAYLHARATRGWTGARAAWLSIVGYLCVIFNFTVVNIYFSGLHSYAGVSG